MWSQHLHLHYAYFKIQKAFGHFLIATCFKTRSTQLLEVGGRYDSSIVTSMPIGPTNVQVDAFENQQNFACLFAKHSNTFDWYTYHQQRQLIHFPDNTISQICDNYLIQLKLRSMKLRFCDLSSYGSSEEHELFIV